MQNRSAPHRKATRVPDIVVAGGGIIGLAVAWRLAQAGAGVAVVEPGGLRPASTVAAGMLAPVTEAHYGEEALLELNLASSERYPSFVAELEALTGMHCGYRRCGTLVVARDRDDNEALDDLFAFQIRLGLQARRLRGRECRALEPGLTPGVRGGIWVESDHQVDPSALLAALRAACAQSGVTFAPGRVTAIEHGGGRASGVTLETGDTLECTCVVVAAGCWSSQIGGLDDLLPPVRPVKGQVVHAGRAGTAPLMQRNVRGLEVYLVPRADGRVVVGGTVEEMDYDMTVTAGAVHDLLRAAYELVPGINEIEFAGALAGLRPGTPDNAPLLGATAVDNVIAATGHYRNGVLLAPVTADAVSETVVTGTAPSVIEPFSPRRFARRDAVLEAGERAG